MSAKLENIIDNLTKKFPDWQNSVLSYLVDDTEIEDEVLLEEFWLTIRSLCELIRANECALEEVITFFKNDIRDEIRKLLKNRLRPYFACEFIRKFEKENRNQLESLIDEIWQHNTIRRNPGYVVEPTKSVKLDISEKEINEFILTLNAIVDHCISRLLNYEGMTSVIQIQMGISEELSEYIARKIDRAYDELRINYLIKRLTARD